MSDNREEIALAACRMMLKAHSQLFTGLPLMMNGKPIDHTFLNEAYRLAENALSQHGDASGVERCERCMGDGYINPHENLPDVKCPTCGGSGSRTPSPATAEPSEFQITNIARAIGNTINQDNHIARARAVWRAAFSPHEEPIPKGQVAFPTPKPDPVAAEREACAKCKHWQEKSVGLESAFLLASEDNRKLERLLTTAVQHIEHMAAWISEKQAGYVFEAIGEDLPDLLAAIRSRSAP